MKKSEPRKSRCFRKWGRPTLHNCEKLIDSDTDTELKQINESHQ